MGVVYLAEDPVAKEAVAIKVPSREAAEALYGAAAYQGMFYNETRAVSGLRHPHIVQLRDAGFAGDDYYIVMQYVEEANTLEQFASGERLLSPARIAQLGLRCAEALDYAHCKGVIHRDIKPSNILLTREGAPMIVDFGIAQLAGSPADDTAPLMPVGSPLYMSPEQVENGPTTGRSDIYSLGVVLYELLTGLNPFADESMPAIGRRILQHRPPRPSSLRHGTPPALDDIVMQCLEKHPSDRFASAQDLAAALADSLAGAHRPIDVVLTERRVERLLGLPFFAPFRESDVWELLRWAQWHEVPAGAVVVEEDSEGDELFILVGGQMRVSKRAGDVVYLQAGECFGEVSFLAGQRRSASVTCVEASEVLSISAEQLSLATDGCQVAFQRQLIQTLVGRLVETTRALVGGPGA